MLKLKKIKTEIMTISPELLIFLQDELGLINFVETGTYLGETTENASNIFDEVYSIELSEKLYQKAKEKFQDKKNVKLYQGDSTEELPKILNHLRNDVLFWLDGHYSGGITAKGSKFTPIMEELESIAESRLANFAILIDDVRVFEKDNPNNPEAFRNYPSINELYEKCRYLFPECEFKVLGDVVLLVDQKGRLEFSNIINALTISRLAGKDKIPDEELLENENVIANALGLEKFTLLDLPEDYISSEKFNLGAHYRYWRSLILANNNKLTEAEESYIIAKEMGFSDIRMKTYFDIKEKLNSKSGSIKISVITPSFNQAKYIEQNIKSVLNQKYENFEHIVVDGGSTDGTIDILNKYPHINWVSEEDNGQSEALNKALKKASGDIIAWLNTDDFYPKGLFHKLNEHFTENPRSKAVIGDCLFYREKEQSKLIVKNHDFDFEKTLRYWEDFVPPTQPSIFFRRDLLEKVGLIDESLNYAMDYDLWLRITQETTIEYLPYLFSVYRFTDVSKSGAENDWSPFYPEWHKVYLRYKTISKLIPNETLLSIFLIHDSENSDQVKDSIKSLQKNVFKDIEVFVIGSKWNGDYLQDNIIGINFIEIENLNENSIYEFVQNSKSTFKLIAEPGNDLSSLELGKSISKMLLENLNELKANFLKSEVVKYSHSNIIFREFPREESQAIEKIFSVIIPTYNRSDILIKCLESINKQNFDLSKIEVFVIDDGSTDDTRSIVENFLSKFELKYIYQKNSGPGAARNKGINESNGEYLLILNDDAILHSNNLKIHLETLRKFAEQKIAVLGTFSYIDSMQDKPFTYFLEHTSLVFAYAMMEGHKFYNYRFFWTCNVSIQRKAILDAGLFDEDFYEPMTEDTELGYRLQKLGYKVYFNPDAKAEHHHFMNIQGFIKRQEMAGRNIVKLFKKHPEILIDEQKLFGFSNLEENTLVKFKEYISYMEEKIPKFTNFFNELEKLSIQSSDKYRLNQNTIVTRAELVKMMEQTAFPVHLYYFYKGILSALEKKSSEKILTETKTEKKPKLLMTMFGWNDSGGGTMLPRAMATEFVELGYEVCVFYAGIKHPNSNEPYKFEESVESGIRNIGVFNRTKPFTYPNNPELDIYDEKIVNYWEKLVDEFNPDIVHFHNFVGLSFGISNIINKRGIPSFFTPHNYHIIDPNLYMFNTDLKPWSNVDILKADNRIKNKLLKKESYIKRQETARNIINVNIDKTLAISKRVKEVLVDFGCDYNKIDVVYQSNKLIETLKPSKYRNGKVTFGYIGSILPHKGLHIFAEAAAKVNYPANYNIYGDSNQTMIKYLSDLSLGKFNFMGKYMPNQLNQIGEEVDIIVVPSVWEECAGLVIQEAFALGKPVIGARIGGIPEFIKEGVTGWTYPPQSVNNLKKIITEIVLEPEIINKYQRNIESPKTFKTFVNEVNELYKSVLT